MECQKPEMTVADGPEGLKEVLASLHGQALQDAAFRAKEHYILYRLKDQKALLKFDFSQQPYQCWFYDLLGRPATNAVKDVVAEFIWEAADQKQRECFASRSEQA